MKTLEWKLIKWIRGAKYSTLYPKDSQQVEKHFEEKCYPLATPPLAFLEAWKQLLWFSLVKRTSVIKLKNNFQIKDKEVKFITTTAHKKNLGKLHFLWLYTYLSRSLSTFFLMFLSVAFLSIFEMGMILVKLS